MIYKWLKEEGFSITIIDDEEIVITWKPSEQKLDEVYYKLKNTDVIKN